MTDCTKKSEPTRECGERLMFDEGAAICRHAWGVEHSHNDALAAMPYVHMSSLPQTVKRADLFGNVIDTYATETQLNGWEKVQGKLI